MSDSKTRIPLDRAQALAAEVTALLAPACERIEVAGSIRREKPTVGDIEIVAVPQLYYTSQTDLFGQEVEMVQHSELDAVCEDLRQQGRLAHRLSKGGQRAWGSRYKRALYYPEDGGAPAPLDLFAVLPPAQWGVIFAIRTGPGDFSRLLVTSRLMGGAMPVAHRVENGAMVGPDGARETPEEQDFFEALGLAWIPPQERLVDRLKATLRASRVA